jgi:hypothetical protein
LGDFRREVPLRSLTSRSSHADVFTATRTS